MYIWKLFHVIFILSSGLKDDKGYFEGKVGDRVGLVPANYLIPAQLTSNDEVIEQRSSHLTFDSPQLEKKQTQSIRGATSTEGKLIFKKYYSLE